MEGIFLLVAASTGLALIVPILLGWFIGSNEGHGFAGLCIGSAAAFVLSTGVFLGGTAMAKGVMVRELAKEAGPAFYEEVAALRGRHCDVDLVIARALTDHRLSYRDVMVIRGVARPHDLADARSKLVGFRPAEACRTVRKPSTEGKAA